MKKVLLIAMIVLLSSVNPLIFSSPDKVLVVTSVRWIRRSGDVRVLEITTKYYGDKTVLNAKAYLDLPCGQILTEQPVIVGSIDPGRILKLVYAINVSELREDCSARLRIEYDSVAVRYGSGYKIESENGVLTASFKINLKGFPKCSVSISPSVLIRGSTATVTLLIYNNGDGSMVDPKVTVNVEGATIVGEGTPIIFGTSKLNPSKLLAKNITIIPLSSVVLFKIQVDYLNEDGEYSSEYYSISLTATSSTGIFITAEPSKIKSGSLEKIKLKIWNLGSTRLKDAVLRIYTTTGSQLVVTPSVIDVGDIDSGENVEVGVEVGVPRGLSGSYLISYELYYKSEDESLVSIRGSFNVFVVEEAKLTVSSIEVVPQPVPVNGTVVVSITIINLGYKPLNEVNVTINSPKSLKPLRKTYYFVGQLPSQSPMSIPFSFKALEEGVYTISFKITYKDVYGVAWETVRNISIKVEKPSSTTVLTNKPNIPWLALAVALVLVLLVAVWWWRKRK